MTTKISTAPVEPLPDELLNYFLGENQGPLEGLKQLAQSVALADQFFVPLTSLDETTETFFTCLKNQQFIPHPRLLKRGVKPWFGHVALRATADESNFFVLLARISQFLENQIHVCVDLTALSSLPQKKFFSYLRLLENLPQPTTAVWYRLDFNLALQNGADFLEFAFSAPTYLRFGLGVANVAGLNQDLFKQVARLILKQKQLNFIFTDSLQQFRLKKQLPIGLSLNPLNQLCKPFELMPLAAVNLNNVTDAELQEVITCAIHFLDNCLELTPYPDEEVRWTTQRERRLCINLLGLAERTDANFVRRLQTYAWQASQELGKHRGAPHKIRHHGQVYFTRHQQTLGQCDVPSLGHLAGTPSYLFKREMTLKDFYALYPTHLAVQEELTNIAAFRHPTRHIDLETLIHLLLHAHAQGLIIFSI